MYGIAALEAAQKNPQQALQRAQMQPASGGVPPDLMRVMAAQLATEKLAEAQRQLQMQQTAAQGTIADQVGQELTDRSQGEVARQVGPAMQQQQQQQAQQMAQGVAALPAPNITPQAMAAGGIVGYAAGGSTDRARYAQMIREEAAKQGMDPELALRMFMQESGLNPQAVSPKGASGLAQLMEGTARDMGLTDEERFVPEKAIPAGIGYFMQQQQRFGDPQIAAAAYNWGPGNVGRNLRSAGDDFSKVKLPKETADYLTKLFPASEAAAAEPPKPSRPPVMDAPSKPRRPPTMNEQAYEQMERKGSIYDENFGLPPEERARAAELSKRRNLEERLARAEDARTQGDVNPTYAATLDKEIRNVRAELANLGAGVEQSDARLYRQPPGGVPTSVRAPTAPAAPTSVRAPADTTPRREMRYPPEVPQPAPTRADSAQPMPEAPTAGFDPDAAARAGIGRFMAAYGTPRQQQLTREQEAYRRMLEAQRAAVPQEQSGLRSLIRNMPTVWRDPRTGAIVGGGYGSAISGAQRAVEAQNQARLAQLAEIESKNYLGESSAGTKQSELALEQYKVGEAGRGAELSRQEKRELEAIKQRNELEQIRERSAGTMDYGRLMVSGRGDREGGGNKWTDLTAAQQSALRDKALKAWDDLGTVGQRRALAQGMTQADWVNDRLAALMGGAPSQGRVQSDQDREALNWARSNPSDPRSAAILTRLGVQ